MKKITKTLAVAILLIPAFTLSVATVAGEKMSKKQKKCHVIAAAKTGLKNKELSKKGDGAKAKKYLSSYNDCMKGKGSGMPKMPKF